MSNVIDFGQARQEREPHVTGLAVCLNCKAEWSAVAPVGTFTFTCPECNTDHGVLKGTVLYGEEVFTCRCGCDLLRASRNNLYCAHCGAPHNPFEKPS
jgi:hypothetical protein